MTGDPAQAVATRLHRLADGAEPTAGTAERAVAAARRGRRRGARWAVAALVVVLLVTAASLARTSVGQPEDATAADRPTPTPPALYEQPVRGSLADDADFLAAMEEEIWPIPLGQTGTVLTPEPETLRVVYAADVPGGHRWAVVLGRSGVQWLFAWFTGPRGAEPRDMTLALEPMPLLARQEIALMDVSAATGPLVVLAGAGEGAEWSPSLDRAPDGRLVRTFEPLPVVDGVPQGDVTMPITWNAGEVYVVGDRPRRQVTFLLPVGTPPWVPTLAYGPGPPDNATLASCLTDAGIPVVLQADGETVSWQWNRNGDLSSAEQAAFDRTTERCYAEATQG